MRNRPLILGVVVTLGILVPGAYSLSDRSPSHTTGSTHGSAEEFVYVQADYVNHFETVEDMLRRSDEVVIGTVRSERRGVRRGNAEAPEHQRILTIAVERVLKGGPLRQVDVETLGWMRLDGQERKMVEYNGIWLRTGDRVLIALTQFEGRRGASSSQSVLLLGPDGQVARTGRRDPLIRHMETLTEVELVAQLEAG